MKIKIDIREKGLIDQMHSLDGKFGLSMDIVTLPIGDVIICDEENEYLIIERKTLRDLAASIKDGRYEEQSFRLGNGNYENHHVIYLIEGDLRFYNEKYTRIPLKTLYSAMFCLNYCKGFSIIRTINISETVEYIIRMADKLNREKDKKGYYSGRKMETEYSSVVKKVKKSNITPDNIGSIILSQIPGISSVISSVIMNNFHSFYHLLDSLKTDVHCLDNIVYATKGGKSRHLSKRSIENIIKYLLYQKEEIIKVDTL